MGGLEPEQAAQLGAQAYEVLAARLVAVQRCGEVVDRATAPAAPEAVPAALRRLVDMQAGLPIIMKRARHLAMTRDLDAEQPPHIDVGRDRQQRIITALLGR